jgi:arylsulfatase A-like enzyme
VRPVYLVWALPFEKILLLLGFTFFHHSLFRLRDLMAIVPEASLALLVTLLYRKYSRIRWLSLAMGWAMPALAFASWFVIVPWMVSGTPLPYELLDQLASDSATLKTVFYSPDLLTKVIVWIGVFVSLCASILLLSRWVEKKRSFPAWLKRTELLILSGMLVVASVSFSDHFQPLYRFALIAPIYSHTGPLTSLNKLYDPSAMSVLGPPERNRSSSRTSSIQNVLLIVMESVRYQPDSLFDRSFPQAIHFDRVYAHHPRSVKTLEPLLFGIYPSVPLLTAAWAIDNYDIQRMDPLPRVLRENGYSATYYAGGNLAFDNYREVLKASGFEKTEMVAGPDQLTWGAGADGLFTKILETLKEGQTKQKKQFIMAWTTECHMPYDFSPGKERANDPLTQYLACQNSLAASLQNMLNRIEASGALDKTLVIVLGDHGQIFSNEKEGEWGHGQHVYEQSVRIPMLVFAPGRSGSRDNQRLFQPVDVPSTILSALGLPIPRPWVGRDMLDRSEPGRDFVVFLSTLSDGIMGLLEKSGEKYVRNKPDESLLRFDIASDPLERTPLPVDKETELAVEKKMNTYLGLAMQGWESKRSDETLVAQSFRGDEIARKWGNHGCIEVLSDASKKVSLVTPVISQECQASEDPFTRSIFKTFAPLPADEAVRLEFKLMITQTEELQGKQPHALVKIWGMEQPLRLDLQPAGDSWQTVKAVLPKPKVTIDPSTGQKGKDLFIGIVPVDLPVHFALGEVTVDSVRTGPTPVLTRWFSRLRRFVHKVF